MSVDALAPFAVPESEVVEAGDWLVERSGTTDSLPLRLDDWDYATELVLRREFSVANAATVEATQAGPGARLAVIVLAESTSTRIRRMIFRQEVASDSVAIFTALEPTEMGGTVSLRTLLVVDVPDPITALSPRRPGSILWSDTRKVVLEGSAARFPLELVSFEKTGNPHGAPWRIDFYDSDPEAPAASSARVLVNSDHELARKMALDPGESGETRALAASLEADIACRMLALVVGHSEYAGDSEYPPGSLGEALNYFVRIHFPREDAVSLRSTYAADRGRVEAELLGSLESYTT